MQHLCVDFMMLHLKKSKYNANIRPVYLLPSVNTRPDRKCFENHSI